jgi:2-amino-4-hydroxy-6-hydroxymethyldihydropteridine diphosphokinase
MLLRTVYLSLGSNLGHREEQIRRATAALESESIHIRIRSSLYETEPQDVTEQPWFLNAVVSCQVPYFPIQLLQILQRVERELGRVRAGAVRRGPRTIDIDILLYGSTIIETPRLIIPHPRLLQRRFVLEPLVEIAPDLRHPQTKQLLKTYLVDVSAQRVRKWSSSAPGK